MARTKEKTIPPLSYGAVLGFKVWGAMVAIPAIAFVVALLISAVIPGCHCDEGAGCHGCGPNALVETFLFGGFVGALCALMFGWPIIILVKLFAPEPSLTLPNERRTWDASFAYALPGHSVLVSVSYFDGDAEAPLEQQQVFGRVVSVDRRRGILLSLEGQRTGEPFKLPPKTSSFRKAEPGEYRLQSTGEVVVNPDLTATFSIRKQVKARTDA